MRRVLSLLLVLLLSACAVPAEVAGEETPPSQEVPADPAPEETPPEEEEILVDETADHVVLTLDAPLADGRTLRLEAVGRGREEFGPGIREVRVYDGNALIQTILAREGLESELNFDQDVPTNPYYDYTVCWSSWEGCMEALDLNFDGNTDFGLFGWPCNNIIPYFYWTWDQETEQYRFACILQGAEAHPEMGENGEVTAEYKSGMAGSQWVTEHYMPDENGELYLQRVERLVLDFQPDSGYLDSDREGAREVWLPKEGDFLRPRPAEWSIETDLVLVSREVPVFQVNADNTASYFMEIWEFWDGEPQLVERKEYDYEDRQ